MSSLIFYTDPQQAFVATDTKMVDFEGNHRSHTTKAIYLPHLRTIVASTGLSPMLFRWAYEICHEQVFGGIEELDHSAPDLLRDVWRQFEAMLPEGHGKTATVYHFGISEFTGEIAPFAYRSTNNFASERLQYGTGAKPDCTIIGEGNLFENIPVMMEEQRRLQEAAPASERIYIGGEILGIHLTANGCSHYRMGELSD